MIANSIAFVEFRNILAITSAERINSTVNININPNIPSTADRRNRLFSSDHAIWNPHKKIQRIYQTKSNKYKTIVLTQIELTNINITTKNPTTKSRTNMTIN